jgi:hypothetical protein
LKLILEICAPAVVIVAEIVRLVPAVMLVPLAGAVKVTCGAGSVTVIVKVVEFCVLLLASVA